MYFGTNSLSSKNIIPQDELIRLPFSMIKLLTRALYKPIYQKI